MEINRRQPRLSLANVLLTLIFLIATTCTIEIGYAFYEERSSSIVTASPYKTAPADLPQFGVQLGEGTPAPGFIFLAYYDFDVVGRNNAYLLILDNNAEPVYYNSIPGIPSAFDFKKQPNGQLTYFVTLKNHLRFYALDKTYQLVGSYEAGNGYTTDLHDLQVLENGHALLLIYDKRQMDMTEYGGKPNATVVDCIVQELDEDKNVIFEWNSKDHIEVTETIVPLDTDEIRYIHCNSVEQDFDGNIILSNHGLSQVTKINRVDGSIIWRLGGKKSDFEFTNDGGFSVQHDARRQPNGNITVYDNGNYNRPRFSRGVEYKLILNEGEEKGEAIKVREYRTTPDTWALALGNMQKLSNGNVLVGWGRSSLPVFTEFTEEGKMILQFSSKFGTGSYRVFRFPWQGYPSWPPSLVAEKDSNKVNLYFSWNGSTETAFYKILVGQSRNNLMHQATVPRTGFETNYELTVDRDGLWYFQVVPVDNQGRTGIPSNLSPVVVGRAPLFLPLLAAD